MTAGPDAHIDMLSDFPEMSTIAFEELIRPVLPTKLRAFDCHYGGTHDHGHTACYFFVLAADEIDRLRAELADLRESIDEQVWSATVEIDALNNMGD